MNSLDFILNNFIWLYYFVTFFFACLLVFFERRNPQSTLIWLLVLFAIPYFGFLLYLLFGLHFKRERIFQLKGKAKKSFLTLANLQDKLLVQKTFPFGDTRTINYADFIQLNLYVDYAIYTENNQIQLFHDGKSFFENFFKDIEKAEHSIYLEFYIIRNDVLGNQFLELLMQKAKSGISVRLIIDDMGFKSLYKRTKILRLAGVQVEVYGVKKFPFVPRINYRNHRKLTVIDNKIGYLGGFNVGDEYIGQNTHFGFWRDTHFRVTGDIIDMFVFDFLLDWNFAAPSPQEILLPSYALPGLNTSNIGMQLVTSGPDSLWPNIRNSFLKMISEAEHYIYIATPYFIPDESILNALKVAAISGREIIILIPSIPDHHFVFWANRYFAGELLEVGARLFEYKKGFLHCKILLVDDYISSIGTANMDARSFHINFEITSFIFAEEVAKDVKAQFEKDLLNSHEITLEEYLARSTTVKLKESVSRLFAPLL
ncbi:MAG: cardiolipin synthase [Clostridia bacterium]